MNQKPHPKAGQKVFLVTAEDPQRGLVVPGAEFDVDDWFDRVYHKEIDIAAYMGNWAAVHYVARARATGLPLKSEEAVCGKIGGIVHIVHDSEF